MIFQVPLPTGEVWVQFPIVAVIVACFALAGAGIFFFTKWIWGEYKKERDKDLEWRGAQNKLREEAVAEQNKLWRESMAIRDAQIAQRDARYEQYDRERQGTLREIAVSVANMANDLKDHDERAKNISHVVNRVDENTRPLPGMPGKE